MKLTDKIRRDWQSYAVGLVTWVISFWAAGLVIRRCPAEEA